MTQNGTEESQPMTRFQKVASALRGDKPDQDPAGTENGDDYWDDESSAANQDRPVAVTRPDGLGAEAADEADARPDTPAAGAETAARAETAAGAETAAADDHQTTQPDIFGTTARPDPGEAPVPAGAVTPEVSPEVVTPEAAPGAAPGAVTPEAAPGAVTPEAAPGAVTPEAAPGAVTPEAGAAEAPAAGRPGEADVIDDFSDIAYGKLIPEATQFREQWQQIQYKFVDDPRGSVTEAADVVAQVTARLEAAIQERQRIITERQRSLRSRWDKGSNADTEALRGTLRMYRAFLDQLLGSRAS
jgi:hypothetical protein